MPCIVLATGLRKYLLQWMGRMKTSNIEKIWEIVPAMSDLVFENVPLSHSFFVLVELNDIQRRNGWNKEQQTFVEFITATLKRKAN